MSFCFFFSFVSMYINIVQILLYENLSSCEIFCLFTSLMHFVKHLENEEQKVSFRHFTKHFEDSVSWCLVSLSKLRLSNISSNLWRDLEEINYSRNNYNISFSHFVKHCKYILSSSQSYRNKKKKEIKKWDHWFLLYNKEVHLKKKREKRLIFSCYSSTIQSLAFAASFKRSSKSDPATFE